MIAVFTQSSQAAEDFANKISDLIVNPIIAVVVILAIIAFVWFFVKYFSNIDNADMHVKSKSHIVWGLIGLTIIFFVVALLTFLQEVGVSLLSS